MIRFSGLSFLVRETLQKNKVTILIFHDIKSKDACRVFRFLKKKYNIISLSTFIRACKTGNKKLLPPKALIITFDDGHKDNYKLLPIVKELNITITIFLCAGIVNTYRNYWFKHATGLSKKVLKTYSNSKRIRILAETGFYQKKEYQERYALSKDEILEMKDAIDFQSHTIFHPCLPRCKDEEAETEIRDSKKNLENDYDLFINAISYPNGDYSDREVNLAQKANYKCGLTIDPGYNTIASDLFRLKRLGTNDSGDLNEISARASGIWTFIVSAFKM